jgi:ketosteroid isomerase-like protein
MTEEKKEEEEEEENVSMVKELYDALGRSDISSVLNMFADDAIAHGPAPADVLPWGGVHNGREGVAKLLKVLGESLEDEQFELHEFIAQRNKVVVLGYAKGHAKPTGRPYEIEFVHVWSVRNGKFSELRVYNNTAALVEALSPP